MEKIYVKVRFNCEDPSKVRNETMNALVFQAGNAVKEAVYIVMASRDTFVKTALINYESLVAVFTIENRTFLKQHIKGLAEQFVKVSSNWGSLADKMMVEGLFNIIEKNEKKEAKVEETKSVEEIKEDNYEDEEVDDLLQSFVTFVSI